MTQFFSCHGPFPAGLGRWVAPLNANLPSRSLTILEIRYGVASPPEANKTGPIFEDRVSQMRGRCQDHCRAAHIPLNLDESLMERVESSPSNG